MTYVLQGELGGGKPGVVNELKAGEKKERKERGRAGEGGFILVIYSVCSATNGFIVDAVCS